MSLDEIYEHIEDKQWLANIDRAEYVQNFYKYEGELENDINLSRKFLACMRALLKISKDNMDPILHNKIFGRVLHVGLEDTDYTHRITAIKVIWYMALTKPALIADTFELTTFSTIGFSDDYGISIISLNIIHVIVKAISRIEFIAVLPVMLDIIITEQTGVYVKASLSLDIALFIIINVDIAAISEDIVAIMCTNFIRNDTHDMDLRFARCLASLSSKHYNTIHKFFSPENFADFLMRRHNHKTGYHHNILKMLVQLFDEDGVMREYIYGQTGINQMLDILRRFIVWFPFKYTNLLKVYVLFLRHAVTVPEEDPKVMVHLMGCMTDPRLMGEVCKLFCIHKERNAEGGAFSMTLANLVWSHVLDDDYYKKDMDADIREQYALLRKTVCGNDVADIPSISQCVDYPCFYFAHLRNPYVIPSAINMISPVVRIVYMENGISLNTFVTQLDQTKIRVTLPNNQECMLPRSTTLYNLIRRFCQIDYNKMMQALPSSLRTKIDEYVVLPTNESELYWLLGGHALLRQTRTVRFLYGMKNMPFKWTLNDIVRPGVDHITLFQYDNSIVIDYPRTGLHDTFDIPDIDGVMPRLSMAVIDSLKNDEALVGCVSRLSVEMFIRLCNAEESFNTRSHAIEFIHRHPLLFQGELRIYAFLMRNLSLEFATRVYAAKFDFIRGPRIKVPRLTLKLTRDNLYKKSVEILTHFGQSEVPLLFMLEGKMFHPFKFYTMFAAEHVKTITDSDDRESIVPKSDVSSCNIRLLGVLFAHILYLGCVVDVRMCHNFFDLMRDNFGCIEQLHLSAQQALNVRAAFIQGFNSVYIRPYDNITYPHLGFEELLALFTNEELVEVFAGMTHTAALEHLCQGTGIKPSGGYAHKSPQLAMFKSILQKLTVDERKKLFFKITGMECIPTYNEKNYIYFNFLMTDAEDNTNAPIRAEVDGRRILMPQYHTEDVMRDHILYFVNS
jgi:hypothetical protein